MSEIMSAVNTYLHGKVTSIPADVPEDFFTGDSDSEIMCRHDPSPLVLNRFLNGSFRAVFNFSYYMKAASAPAARQKLEAIQAALNIQNFEGLFGVTEGRLEAVTRPTPVEEREGGVTIYTSSFRLVYFQEV